MHFNDLLIVSGKIYPEISSIPVTAQLYLEIGANGARSSFMIKSPHMFCGETQDQPHNP